MDEHLLLPSSSEPQLSSSEDAARSHGLPAITVRHLLTLGVWIIALAIAAYLFGPLKNLVLGLLATGAVASALHPLMRFVPGPRGLRAAVVGMLPLVVLAAVVALGYLLMAEPIRQAAGQLPEAQAGIDQTLAGWSEKLGLSEPITLKSVAQHAGETLTGGGGGKLFAGVTGAIGGAMVALAFVFFGSVYLLADDLNEMVTPIARLLPPRRREPFRAALLDIVPQLRWWLIGMLFSIVVVSITSAIGYWLIGLKLALALALLAGLCELIPTLGPMIAFVIGLLFAAGQGGEAIAGVLGVYVVVQTLESYVLTPLVMREAVKMPPLVTLFSVILWGQVFGAVGLLLAIPINIVIWAFVDRMLLRPDSTENAIEIAAKV